MAFHLSGTLTVPASDLERVRAALPEHKRLTLLEPGCRAFSVDEQADGVFMVNEAFVDEAAFVAHQMRIRGTAWAEASASAVRDYRTWQDRPSLPANRSMPGSVIIPTSPYADVIEAARWLERVFGLAMRLQIGTHRVQLVTPEGGDMVVVQAGDTPSHCAIMVRVADVDAVHARIVSEGGTLLGPPQTFPYGERQFTAIDCGGHAWTFSQSVADVAPASWGGVTGTGF